MNLFNSCASFALVVAAVPALASVNVSSPVNNSTVGTTFPLVATASPCLSQAIASMGYSVDFGATKVVDGAYINAQVTSPTGAHMLHVKSWGNKGASCVSDVPLNVVISNSIPPISASTSATTTTNVSVSAPLIGASVASPFTLTAAGTLCSGQAITAFGYSLDNSSNTAIINGTGFSTLVSATSGAHVVHVKSWGNQGAGCLTNVSITVIAVPVPPVSPKAAIIPANAIAIKSFQTLPNWIAEFDAGTSGAASGSTGIVANPSLSGTARQYAMNYNNYAGERFSAVLDNDGAATHFVLDTMIYFASPANTIANLEIDLNQVMSNGHTVIFGFQCDGWSRTWDYTANTGTSTSPRDQWLHSTQSCNPQTWATNSWHHVQISYSRDSSGNVTYNSVWLDGVQQDLGVTVNSDFALGWAANRILVNVQVDGMTSTAGSATIYTDNMILYRW